MRYCLICLAPLATLIVLAAVASLLGFALLQVGGDFLPLNKLISKLTLMLLLLAVFPLRKRLRLSWQDLGFATPKLFFQQMGQGLVLALLTLLPVLLTLYGLDVQVWDQDRVWNLAKIAEKTSLALLLSILIALGEELLFRGLLLSGLSRKLPVIFAIGISAFYYAALHFLKSKTPIPYAQQTVDSGFRLMAEAFSNWLEPGIQAAFIGLFVVGVFLALLRTRVPRSIGLCIGCHAGWVWQIKLSKDFFNVNPQADYLFLVSNYDGVVGPLVSVWLTIVLLIWMKIRQTPAGVV